MNYPRIFQRLYCEPLCLSRARFESIHAVFLPRVSSPQGEITLPQPEAAMPTRDLTGKRAQKARPSYMPNGAIDPNLYTTPQKGVAVVPIYGVLSQHVSYFEESCGGGTDVEPIGMALRQALAAPDIKTIILDIASPGGSVGGIQELASAVRAATRTPGKTVYAFTDSEMCSAAYWIGSQADEIYTTPSATVGSIGVYLALLDQAKAMEMAGLKLELFTSGKHKGIGLPGRGMSEEDRSLLQAQVDQIAASFKGAVTKARPNVKDDTMQGQTFRGNDVIKRGLADDTVNDFEELLSLL